MKGIFETFHEGFETVVRKPERVLKKDYGAELLKDLPNSFFRERKFEEYRKLGFPVWKRMELAGLELPDFPPACTFDTNLQSVMDCSDLSLFESLDFPGSDRKYVLLADVFHTCGVCSALNGFGFMRMEGNSIDSSAVVVEGDSKLDVLYKSSFRVSNIRVLVKKGSSLLMRLVSLDEGFSISNIYIFLEEGAKVEFEILQVSLGKAAVAVMTEGKEGSAAKVSPRLGVKNGVFDSMFWSKAERESTVEVEGKGIVAGNGKMIFRGVMNINRGFKSGEYHEHFKTLLLDEKSSFEAIPSLFVADNEVSASHGVSSSPLPDDELFYLLSRGFDKQEATEMIAKGFIMDLEFPEEAADIVDRLF